MHGKRISTNTYPQIIDKATFEQVQKRLVKNKILAGANSAVEPYILTGKAFCGYCGESMTAGGGTSHTGQKHYYYVCHGKRKCGCRKSSENKNTLEYTVASAVFNFLSRRENAEIAAQDTVNHYERGKRAIRQAVQRRTPVPARRFRSTVLRLFFCHSVLFVLRGVCLAAASEASRTCLCQAHATVPKGFLIYLAISFFLCYNYFEVSKIPLCAV